MFPGDASPSFRPTRRSVLGAAALGVAGSVLAGCARGSESRPAPGDTLTLYNDNPTWADGYADASAVLRRQVGYVLSARAVPNVSNYQQIVRMSAQTDSTSDLVKWWNGYRLQDVSRAGIFADVSPAWANAKQKGWVDDPSLQDAFTYDGKQYGVPMYKAFFSITYSKKAFAKIGAEPPQTWDDFLGIVDKAVKAGITPVSAGGATTWESLIWFEQLLIGTDPDYYQKVTADQASYTDEPAQKAMQMWVDLYKRGAFSAPDIASSDVAARLKEGSTAMFLYGTWNTGAYITAGLTDKDFGGFMLPSPNGKPAIIIESAGLAVSVDAHKKQAAMDVVTAWLAPAVQEAWCGFLKDNSPTSSVQPTVASVRDVRDQVKQANARQLLRYWEASPPALIEGNVQDLSAFMTSPSDSAARKALSSMQKRSDKEWKVWNS